MKRLSVLLIIMILSVQTALAVIPDISEVPYLMDAKSDFPSIYDKGYEDALMVFFLGIGSQDSMLIASGGKTMLIDCGYYLAGNDVYKRLKKLGVTHIDYAINTHPHDDHLLGFMTLLEHDITIGTFYYVFDEDHTAVMTRFMKYAGAIGLNTVKITADDDISFGSCQIRMFRYAYKREDFTNNSSLVMKISKGDNSVLLCADITEPEENRLADDYGDLLKCDIMKMAHHGITLPQWKFMNAADPDFCVLTNSIGNTPIETRDRFELMGKPVVMTTCGTVCCMTFGYGWKVKQQRLVTDPLTVS